VNIRLMKEIIKEMNAKAVFLPESFDKALVGTAAGHSKVYVANYDADKCIEILMGLREIGELEAFEDFKMTVEDCAIAENKPVFTSDLRKVKTPPPLDLDINGTIADLL
jgi:hypothetical protein